MNEAYPKSDGALFFNNEKQKETHPDWRGRMKLTPEQIKTLIAMSKQGLEMELQLGAWKRTSKAGQDYIFLSSEAYVPKNQPQQDWQQPAAQANTGWGQSAPPLVPAHPSAAPDDDFDDDIPF